MINSPKLVKVRDTIEGPAGNKEVIQLQATILKLEEKLRVVNKRKRNNDKKLREANAKLKQIEELVGEARVALHNPVLIALPQEEV